MKVPEHYESDVLFFFDGRPDALALYQGLEAFYASEFLLEGDGSYQLK